MRPAHIAGRQPASPTGISKIRLERTRCYGPCPAYEVELTREGRAVYVGEAFVDRLGVYMGFLDPEEFERLALLIEGLGFFDLRSSYSIPVTDNPTYITTVEREGVTKRVSNYAGAGPAELWAIEELIDAAADEVDWEAP